MKSKLLLLFSFVILMTSLEAQEEYKLIGSDYDGVITQLGRTPDKTEVKSGFTSMRYYEAHGRNTTEYILNPFNNLVTEINVNYVKIATEEKHKQNIKNFAKVLKQYGFEHWKTIDNPYREIYSNGKINVLLQIQYAGGNHENLESFTLSATFIPDITRVEKIR